MELEWVWAGPAQLDALVKTRVMVLRAANRLDEQADLRQVEANSRAYYLRSLADGSHAAILVYDEKGHVVGTGGVSFFQVMPTCCNPSGRKAYIMNMYTAPEYRRQGIARRTLDLLVDHCRAKGVDYISLEATEAGRPLYARYGFVPMENEMRLEA